LTDRCRDQDVEIRFVQPGKPDQNACIERFSRTCREEVMSARLFDSLSEVREITAEWPERYDEIRPNGAPGSRPPAQYREQLLAPETRLGTDYLTGELTQRWSAHRDERMRRRMFEADDPAFGKTRSKWPRPGVGAKLGVYEVSVAALRVAVIARSQSCAAAREPADDDRYREHARASNPQHAPALGQALKRVGNVFQRV
jgi:hypothetical protein